MLKMSCAVALVLLALLDEGNDVATWTPEQRQAQRDLVIKGKIKHVLKAKRHENKGGAETWGGAMVVEASLKGGYKPGDTFPFFFERGKPLAGKPGRETRTPPYPDLKRGDTGTFYFKLMSPADKARVGESPSNAQLYLIETPYDFVPAEAAQK